MDEVLKNYNIGEVQNIKKVDTTGKATKFYPPGLYFVRKILLNPGSTVLQLIAPIFKKFQPSGLFQKQ